jgi:hydrogenase nickel incorporation protein HypA/HybF
MHELAITQSMLDIVLEQAEQAGARKVTVINLAIGELSGYVEESVRFYFDFISKGTPTEAATLNFKPVAAQGKCRACGHISPLDSPDWRCPKCRASDIEIIAGKELFIESIEVDD